MELKFNEELHQYSYNGKTLISVTQFIHKFKKNIFTESFVSDYAKKKKVDENYIKTLWKLKRDYSNVRGTEIHFFIESFIKNWEDLPVMSDTTTERKYFMNFVNKHNPEFIESEFRVFDEALGIAGTIDCIAKVGGKLAIIDWKTNTAIEDKSKYGNKFERPIEHLDDCEVNTYALQLSIYKYILEKNYDMNIDALRLVWLNKSNDNFKVIKLDYMEDDIKKMFATQF